MRQTYETMGTVVSLDVPGCSDNSVFLGAYNRLAEIDVRFSTYKPDSEISRYRRGELKDKEISAELRKIKAACAEFEKLTDGYFTAQFAGKFDSTGYVKGWAIAEAAKEVRKAGYGTFCIAIGGDILAASDSDKVWAIGIQDPHDKSNIIKRLEIKNGAVATSGTYERGSHIIDPKTGRPADYWASVTVSGPDIITSDVLATACFAAGQNAAKILRKFSDYELFAVEA